MLAMAPDSVNMWAINNNTVWEKRGVAKKVNNSYEAKIDQAYEWNFAVAENGVYVNLHLKTEEGATITNTAVRIKNDKYVIAEGETDADGNVLLFVPAHTNLTAEVLPDRHTYINDKYTQSIGVVSKTSDINVSISTKGTELTTISGTAFDCNNNLIKNGRADITLYDGRQYVSPVVYGKFKTTAWLYGINNGMNVKITGDATSTTGDNIYVITRPEDIYNMNFSSCTTAACCIAIMLLMVKNIP